MTSQPTAAQVRRQYIDFFVKQGHRAVPSGPVFPKDDPTLLFTNAGMNQFKDVFLGSGSRDYTRATDSQKCIRVSGKHNDLEEVGVDTYHHTFFEMLGNWSFGDYFKRDAIRWAWQLLTEVWGLPKERLWVTVFSGDKKDGLPADEEARKLWQEETDIDHERILLFDREDNFWEMGDTGPCGPCSEIHIDRGGPGSNPADGADRKLGVNAGNERFIELWNLVFMEFNRLDDGSLKALPSKHVDTGMGFERVLSVLQGKNSNYDTDLFTPIFRALEEVCGKTYGEQESQDIAFRVIADHVRAVTVAFADGALPSNEGRGYVLRRLIRRAARFGRQRLGVEEPFLWRLVQPVSEILREAFPETGERVEHVELLVRSEEQAFGKTLDRGLVIFGRLAEQLEAKGVKTLPGAEAYELYATYGFPQDLVELMARERNMEVDSAGWEQADRAHREVSKTEGRFKQLLSAEELEGLTPTNSHYYEAGPKGLVGEAKVLRYFPGENGPARLVLDQSPFYPEGGGQVGDRGTVSSKGCTFHVEDTKKVGDLVVLIGRAEGSLAPGDEVCTAVDAAARAATQRNHTATHLVHQALRQVLGDHVSQQGSYVGPDRLRFDFSNPKGVDPADLEEIERRVNAQVIENNALTTTVEDLKAAKKRGVMALFGEKYDEQVRVVDVGGWSTELCGGTHVGATGDIGPVVIVSERAIQAGVRRLEALTGDAAVAHMQQQRRSLVEAARSMKTTPEELPGRIAQLQDQLKEARKQKKASSGADLGALGTQLKETLASSGPVPHAVLAAEGLDHKSMRELAGKAKKAHPDLALALIGTGGGKLAYMILCEGKALEAGLAADRLAGEIAAHLGGGGGGRPNSAQGSGEKPAGLKAAIEHLEAAFAQHLR